MKITMIRYLVIRTYFANNMKLQNQFLVCFGR